MTLNIRDLSETLKQLGFDIEEASWLNPVPHVWSVTLRDRRCPMLEASGKGVTREAALENGLGEFFSRLMSHDFFADYYLGRTLAAAPVVHYPNERWFEIGGDALPTGLLDEPSLRQYNMKDQLEADMLVDTGSGNSRRGVCALPFERQATGEQVWFPVNVIGNLYKGNGIGVGATHWEARVEALSKIFERHIKTTIISSGISLPGIPDEEVARYPKAQAAINALRERGFGIVVKDASLAGKFPLVNVTLLDPANGSCIAAFGAHPKFELALERAVTGLLQGRSLDQLDGLQPPSFDIQAVADQANLEAHLIDSSGIVAWDLLSEQSDYAYKAWNVEGDSQAEFDHLCYLIHRVDMDIYIADYVHEGMHSCRIIVPGMSEMYPVENLVSDNNAAGAPLRQRCLKLPALDRDGCEQLLEAIEELGVDEHRSVAAYIGLVTDSGTPWQTLRFGELKALLCLAVGERETALSWVEWVMQAGQLGKERLALYRCLQQCLAFALDEERSLANYEPILRLAHKPELMARSLKMLAGEALFDDLPCDDGSLRQFGNHGRMLDAYQRLLRAQTV